VRKLLAAALLALFACSGASGYISLGGSTAPNSGGGGGGLAISTASLAACTVGSACSDALACSGGAGGCVYNVVASFPNTGLWNYVTPSGTVSGTPQQAEADTVTYQVTDAAGNTAQKSFTLTAAVSGVLGITSATTLPNAPANGYYAYHLIAHGGTPPYVWGSSNAAQPCNLTWDGWIECSPGSSGAYSIAVTVTDAAGATASQTESITINQSLTLGDIDPTDGVIHLPPAIAGQPYHAILSAYGGSQSSYVYSISSGPSWLTVSGNVLSGTPLLSGNVAPVFKVTDSLANSATATGIINVSASARVSRPAYNASSSNGYFVLGGQFYNPQGFPFRIRGLNRNHYDSNSWSGGVNGALTGANTVRYWLFATDGSVPIATYVSGFSQQHLNNGEFPIITMQLFPDGTATSGNTSTTELQSGVNWWVANEGSFAPYMGQIGINIANEWGPSSANTPTNWVNAYESAIASLRAAGYTCPIFIDTGNSGQDPSEILTFAAAIQNSDPLKNIVFSFHAYGNTVNYTASISNIVSSGSQTVITLSSSLPYHPFLPIYPSQTGNTFSGINGYFLSGVGGMTQINGAQPSTTNIGGSPGSWTVTLNVNSSGFPAYTSGGTIVADSVDFASAVTSYAYLFSEFAALRAQNVDVLIGEFGPGTDGSTGSTYGIGKSGTQTSVQQIVGAAEAYQLGWLDWAWDDNNSGGGATTWAAWFGHTLSGPGHYASPANLTASGLDIILNPRYGLQALGGTPPGPPAPPTGSIKFNPGWFLGSDANDGSPTSDGGNGRNLSEISILATTGSGGGWSGSNFSGYAPTYHWGFLEPTAGTYNLQAIRDDFNNLQAHAPGAHMIIQVKWDSVNGGTFTRSDEPDIPADILSNCSTYGAGPPGGTGCGWGLSQYQSGTGTWAVTAAAMWRPAIQARWLNFLTQIANYSFTVTAGPLAGQTLSIDNNPEIEAVWDWAEDSWSFWQGPAEAADYSDAALQAAFQSEMANVPLAFPHTNFATFQSFGWANDGFPSPSQAALVGYAASHRNSLSNSDTFGSTSIGVCGVTQICAYQTYIGLVWNGSAWVSGGTDLRGTMGLMANVQSYDYGHTTGPGSTISDTINNIYAQMQTLHATHGVWNIWDEATGTPSSFVSTYLKPFVDAHPTVPNTTRPTNIN